MEGSGWIEIYLFSSFLKFLRKSRNFLNCSGKTDIKQARYANQATLAALTSLAKSTIESHPEFIDYQSWRNHKEIEPPTGKFWFNVIGVYTIFFMFVSNFELFLGSLE